MNKIIKKSMSAIASVLFVSCIISQGAFACCVDEKEKMLAKTIQARVIKNFEKDKLQSKILKNEREIKNLENNVRVKLDHKLSVLLEAEESTKYRLNHVILWFKKERLEKELKEIQEEISKIKKKIAKNESQIKNLKERRTRLDEKLAVILQNKELESF